MVHKIAVGALAGSPVKLSVATTGVAGPESEDEIPPGTACFAWAFSGQTIALSARTYRFLVIVRPPVRRERSAAKC